MLFMLALFAAGGGANIICGGVGANCGSCWMTSDGA